MFCVYFLIVLVVASCRRCDAMSAETCHTPIKHNHCVIEYASKDRIAHIEKYTYNTLFRRCMVLRWSENLCPLPTGDVNLFNDKEICTRQCSGHA